MYIYASKILQFIRLQSESDLSYTLLMVIDSVNEKVMSMMNSTLVIAGEKLYVNGGPNKIVERFLLDNPFNNQYTVLRIFKMRIGWYSDWTQPVVSVNRVTLWFVRKN